MSAEQWRRSNSQLILHCHPRDTSSPRSHPVEELCNFVTGCVLVLLNMRMEEDGTATGTGRDNNSYKTGKLKLFSFVDGNYYYYMSRCISYPGRLQLDFIIGWFVWGVGGWLAGCWLALHVYFQTMGTTWQHGKKLIFYQTIVAVVVVSAVVVAVGGLLCENPIQKWNENIISPEQMEEWRTVCSREKDRDTQSGAAAAAMSPCAKKAGNKCSP